MRPKGHNFFSYHAPLELLWGSFEVTDVDPAGRSITLAPASQTMVPNYLGVVESPLTHCGFEVRIAWGASPSNPIRR